jgi:hypothetical protein
MENALRKYGDDHMANENQRKVLAITALAELFRRELTEPALDMYIMALDDVPASAIEQAAVRCRKSSRFMPTPAELRELAGVASPEDRALQAFAALEIGSWRFGCYKSPDFDDPLINATVPMLGGWERICGLGSRGIRQVASQGFPRHLRIAL